MTPEHRVPAGLRGFRFVPAPSPPWWTVQCQREAERAARASFPLEVCGLWIAASATGPVRLNVLPAQASPVSFQADPQAVIQLAYRLVDDKAVVRATFHSHPFGFACPSRFDEPLADWAEDHLIAGCRAGAWTFAWWRTPHR
ncbi:MAG: Mov34/MPN/PAD-1 family protein [Alicyclobacillaceae bacterium]|nr:Mov34/MPN/PAD-1 family protein [Alicyclobacillaceae bacterium]